MTTLDPTHKPAGQLEGSVSDPTAAQRPSMANKPLRLPNKPALLATKPARLPSQAPVSTRLPPATDLPVVQGRPFAKPFQLPLRPVAEARDPQSGDALGHLVSQSQTPVAGKPMRRAILKSLRGAGGWPTGSAPTS